MSFQASTRQRIGPVTRAESIGERGLPCGIPNSGSMVSIVKLLNDMETCRRVMKSYTQVIVESSIPK